MLRILIVDDDLLMCHALRRLLEQAGFEASEAPNGHVALERLRQQPADLVFTDIGMPEMDGLQLTATLRFELPAVKIVAMSGAFDIAGDVLHAARALGADGTLTKPVASPEVLRLTRELLGCGAPQHSAAVGAAMRAEPAAAEGPARRRTVPGGNELRAAASGSLRPPEPKANCA